MAKKSNEYVVYLKGQNQDLLNKFKQSEEAAKKFEEKNKQLGTSLKQEKTEVKQLWGELLKYDNSLTKSQSELQKTKDRVDSLNKSLRQLRQTKAESNKPIDVGAGLSTIGLPGLGSIKSMLGAAGLIVGVNEGIQAIKNLVNETVELTKSTQQTFKALQTVSEGSIQYGKNINFLLGISSDYGVELNSLTRSYVKFTAATKDTSVEGEKADKIFRSITKSAAFLGLSADDTEGSLRAIGQMFSKGKIQAEELRGQLSDRLAGSFNILAKSMGVTTGELDKLLKEGKVIAQDVLPAFAEELERVYGVDNLNRIDTIVAAQNRVKTSWQVLVTDFEKGEGIIAKAYLAWLELQNAINKGLISPEERGLLLPINEQVEAFKKLGVSIDDIKKRYEAAFRTRETTDLLGNKKTEFTNQGDFAETIRRSTDEYESYLKIQKELPQYLATVDAHVKAANNSATDQNALLLKQVEYLNRVNKSKELELFQLDFGTQAYKDKKHEINLITAAYDNLQKRLKSLADVESEIKIKKPKTELEEFNLMIRDIDFDLGKPSKDTFSDEIEKLNKELQEGFDKNFKITISNFGIDPSAINFGEGGMNFNDILDPSKIKGFDLVPPEVIERWKTQNTAVSEVMRDLGEIIDINAEALELKWAVIGESLSSGITGTLDAMEDAIANGGNMFKATLMLFADLLKQAGYTYINAGVMMLAGAQLDKGLAAASGNPAWAASGLAKTAQGKKNLATGIALGATGAIAGGVLGASVGGAQREVGSATGLNSQRAVDVNITGSTQIKGDDLVIVFNQANKRRGRGA